MEAGIAKKCLSGNDTVSSVKLSFRVPSSSFWLPCSADKGTDTGSTETSLRGMDTGSVVATWYFFVLKFILLMAQSKLLSHAATKEKEKINTKLLLLHHNYRVLGEP